MLGMRKFTLVHWLICLVASIGFAFDIYEILVLPLIVGPALSELGGLKPGTPAYLDWVGWLFFVPAFAGGIFGMIGGYLTDLWGRRRVLVWSILIYAFSALAAGFSTSLEQLLFFRCTTFIGVCVEFVAAVAWLAELFPEEQLREKVLGYTQAFSSIGGLLVTGAYYIAITNADWFPAIHGGHAPWRYTLISGLLPAIPLMLIRPFLPESPAWAEKKAAGTLKRPSFVGLFQAQYSRTTWVTMIMYAASYAAAFGAIQQIPRIVPGLQELGGMAPPLVQKVVSGVQLWQEMGGLVGRVILAVLATMIVSRRLLIRVFQIPGLFVVPWVFFVASGTDVQTLKWGHRDCRAVDGGAVQLLGQLPAACLSDALAGHGRKLCRQYWRAYAGNVGGVVDHATGEDRAGSGAGRQTGLRGCAGGNGGLCDRFRCELLPARTA